MEEQNIEYKTKNGNTINYYEIKNDNPPLLIIHAQGTNAKSYEKVISKLSNSYHMFLVDCYGHGKSSHNKELYNLESQGNDLKEEFKRDVTTDVFPAVLTELNW